MTPNELPLEKRIDVDLSTPPVCPEEVLNNPKPAPVLGYPPRTRLLLDGFTRDELTADFLVAIHDVADEHGLDLEAISVGQPAGR